MLRPYQRDLLKPFSGKGKPNSESLKLKLHKTLQTTPQQIKKNLHTSCMIL